MIEILIVLIVLGLIWYLVKQLPLPAPVQTVITVIFILILIAVVLRMFGFDIPLRLR